MVPHARVLVADDNEEMLGFVAEAFEQAGAQVTRAEHGVELIERLNDGAPYALVVTDISMPWMSGLQVMQSARFVGVMTPVILITGRRDEQLPGQVAAMGKRVALLQKPFDATALLGLAEALLASPERSLRQPTRP